MKKKILIFILGMLLSLPFGGIARAQANIILQINGQIVQTAVAPILEGGTTLVPIRVVSENLGANVVWDEETQSVVITKETSTMNLVLGQKTVIVNDQSSELDVAPKMIDGTTMVPIRFIAQNLDCIVEWDDNSQMVKIISHHDVGRFVEQESKQEIVTPQYSAGHKVTNDENYIVYITKTGEKYHEGNCSSLRKSKIQTTLGEATDAWYDACDKCNPPILDI